MNSSARRSAAAFSVSRRATLACLIASLVISPGVFSADETHERVAVSSHAEKKPFSVELATALNRSTEGLHVFDLANGGKGVNLDGRFRHVYMVRLKHDGSVETVCVNHRHDAEKLLRGSRMGSTRPSPERGVGSVLLPRNDAASYKAMVPMTSAKAGGSRVRGTLGLDPSRLAGADDLGRMLLYAPNPLEGGSSMSHWDRSATPDLLMEPSASPLVPVGEVDLTLPHFRDIGWPDGSSTVTIRVTDGVETGFNDPTEVPEASNNSGGTTLGGQRLAAMQWAAAIWGSYLRSNIEINIESSFRALDCDSEEGTAVLASAGANFLYYDFANAPRAGTLYHGTLAEALADENLSHTDDEEPPDAGDITVNFNSGIDEGCLSETFRFYYGLDGNTPAGQIPFAMIALHEMAHGLGFSNFVNLQFGTFPSLIDAPAMPDIYTVFTYDKDLELHWDVMTNAERRDSAINSNRVVWDGTQTTNASVGTLDNEPRLAIQWPRTFGENLEVQTAQFGPPVPEFGISGDLAQVRDGTARPNEGCEALTNAAEVAGKIAIVDRGECFFTVKTKNAQDAGALAVVVVNNVPDGLPPMGGDDLTITIPAVGISQADGEAIKEALETATSRVRVPVDRRSAGGARPR